MTPETETVQLQEAIRKGKEDWHIQRATKPAEINYVKSGEVHIAYQVLGSDPVDLLVVPGFVSHLEQIWEGPGVSNAYHRLASFSRLILFDKRGVGLSDRVGYPPTLEHTVDDARSVMDAVGSKHAVLFGLLRWRSKQPVVFRYLPGASLRAYPVWDDGKRITCTGLSLGADGKGMEQMAELVSASLWEASSLCLLRTFARGRQRTLGVVCPIAAPGIQPWRVSGGV